MQHKLIMTANNSPDAISSEQIKLGLPYDCYIWLTSTTSISTGGLLKGQKLS